MVPASRCVSHLVIRTSWEMPALTVVTFIVSEYTLLSLKHEAEAITSSVWGLTAKSTVSNAHKVLTSVWAPVLQGRGQSNSRLSIISQPLNKSNIFSGGLMLLSPPNDTEPLGGCPWEAQKRWLTLRSSRYFEHLHASLLHFPSLCVLAQCSQFSSAVMEI